MRTYFLLFFLISFSLFGSLRRREAYEPWYSGPIVANSAENIDPGSFFLNPFFNVVNSYAETNSSWKRKRVPTLWNLQPILKLETGINNWLDVEVDLRYSYKMKQGKSSHNITDLPVRFGIQLLKQKAYTAIPSMRIKVEESFPIGKYQNLNPDKKGTDQTGSGSYQTNLGLNISKIVYWLKNHPMNLTFNYLYTLRKKVNVTGFNNYGGGFGTKGKVNPGNLHFLDFALEYSFTQNWAIGSDIVYVHSNKTTFSGTPGQDAMGNLAKNGSPSSDQFSLAPVLEYTPFQHMGFYAGVWFTFASRNTSEFVTGSISAAFIF